MKKQEFYGPRVISRTYGLPLGAPKGPLALIWPSDPQAINSLPIKTLDMKFVVFNSKNVDFMPFSLFGSPRDHPKGAPRGLLTLTWPSDPPAINSWPIKTLDMKFEVFCSKNVDYMPF